MSNDTQITIETEIFNSPFVGEFLQNHLIVGILKIEFCTI